MNNLLPACYALQRQRRAVERTLMAASDAESLSAARWAAAWHKLVTLKLAQIPPRRVLH